MTVLGIFLGVLLAYVMGNSFMGFIVLMILGGVIGYQLEQKQTWHRSRVTALLEAQECLENKVELLEKELHSTVRRLSLLEQQSRLPVATPSSNEMPQPSSSTNTVMHAVKAEVAVTPLATTVLSGAEEKEAPVAWSSSTHPPFRAPVASPVYGEEKPSVPDSVVLPIKKISEMPAKTEMPLSVATSSMSLPTDARSESVMPPKAIEQKASFTAASKTKPIPIEEFYSEPSFLEKVWKEWVIGGNPLLKIGIVILFLGLAFLLRYAAEHAVLPLKLRYAGVAATGVALLHLGWRWRERKDHYGLILQGGGIGVLYLTTLAAMKLHPLIPYGFGFAILLAVATFAAILAIFQDALALAIASTLGGFAAPVLASHGGGNHVVFFSYLTLLNLGIVAVAWFKTWRSLNALGFICTFALGSAWASDHYHADLFATTEPFALLLFVFYVLITFLFARRTLDKAPESHSAVMGDQVRHAAGYMDYLDGFLAFAVPFATFGWQYLLVNPMEYGAAFSALGFGLVYLLLARTLFTQGGARYTLLTETMLALGVIFASLAIPLGLEQKWTCAAWAVEAAGMYWIGIRQQRVHARLFSLLLFFGSTVQFILGLHGGGERNVVLDGSWLGCILLAISAGWVYWQMLKAPEEDLSDTERNMQSLVLSASVFFLGLLPFLVCPLEWAAPTLALIGAGAIYAAMQLSSSSVLLRWGALYQLLAGLFFLGTLHAAEGSLSTVFSTTIWISSVKYLGEEIPSPFMHSGFFAPLLIAVAAFICAWLLQCVHQTKATKELDADRKHFAWIILGWAGVWWTFAWATEIVRVSAQELQTPILIAITVCSAGLWTVIARWRNWQQLGMATIAYLPILACIYFASDVAHPLVGWSGVAWPVALLMHVILLRQSSYHKYPASWQSFSHILGVWLFVVITTLECRWHFAQWGEPEGTWPLLGWIIAPITYIWVISRSSLQEKWPLSEHQRAYTQIAVVPMLVYIFIWIWISNGVSNGTALPLPYIPLMNPLELAHWIAVLGIATWSTSRCAQTEERLSSGMIGLGGITVLALITGMVMRTCHHWGNVPWGFSALVESTLVQTSLSIVWSIVAIGLMVSVRIHQQRWVWVSGAALMAIVVIKLFLVELSASGSLARIVSFIVVGLLLLLVGYFAPLPPKASSDE